VSQSLRDAQEIIADGASSLGALHGDISQDPERLQAIQARLDLINNLLHKHRVNSIAELTELFARREGQIREFSDLDDSISTLEGQLETSFRDLLALGRELGARRAEAAARLSAELEENVRQLGIPDAAFQIRIDKKTDTKKIMPEYLAACSEKGEDTCEFMFSANRGAELRPLSAVASGGELSRILLAVKKVLSERIEEKLIILDEIDAGIGGATAERVALFIRQLARRHRILCITHLAQLAAVAHGHIALRKHTEGGRTLISLEPLGEEERVRELARMLSGNTSGISLQHARELISKHIQ
jgi:DNA repair protein RecN (Recombination protein N)